MGPVGCATILEANDLRMGAGFVRPRAMTIRNGDGMKHTALRALIAVCIAAACVGTMSGCAMTSQTASEEAQAQADNRQYMSRVNQISMDIEESLADFEAAAESNDLAAMRTALNAASRSLDELSSLEAPEALADIKIGYVEGCTELHEALSDYLQLYTEANASDDAVDAASYVERLADIQARYTEALQKISDTDELAASL